MTKQTPITVAYGDGIGPEIMKETLKVLDAAGAQLDIEVVEIGEKVYKSGHLTGIEPKTWDSLLRTKVFLKAPITTPQGGGFRSLNVTIRAMLGLYANVRPCVSYAPFVETKHPNMDVVIVRENVEDLYAGIEYQQSPQVCHSIKLISRPGSEKIVRYAFEYAKTFNRKKVTCFSKDNILKFADGLFHKVYDEVGSEYPVFEKEHWIIDIGTAKLADTPENFDVIVLANLYGDILSDIAAQISGSLGLAGSANIGEQGAMFEAIHGSAPRRAGQNVANPSGLMQGAILMLIHIGQYEAATTLHNAWLKTLEDGIHTYDVFKEGISHKQVSTSEFGDAVCARMGQRPSQLKAAAYGEVKKKTSHASMSKATPKKRELVGVDVYIFAEETAASFPERLTSKDFGEMKLEFIFNRGARIYPEGLKETICIDQWRCRFKPTSGSCSHEQIVALLSSLTKQGFDAIKTENLYTFDGKPGYTNHDG